MDSTTVPDSTTAGDKTLSAADDTAANPEDDTSKADDDLDDAMDDTVTNENSHSTAAANKDPPNQSNASDSLQQESNRFSNIYRHLPDGISKSMSENLSIPLAFTCLLHLANEKQLKITGVNDLSDLNIQLKD